MQDKLKPQLGSLPNLGHPSRTGLALDLPMLGAGDLHDYSLNGNDGTNNGATWVAGENGPALSFDGVNDYVTLPDIASLHPTGAFTVSVTFTTDSPTTRQTIAGTYSNSSLKGWALSLSRSDTDSLLYVTLRTDGTNYLLTPLLGALSANTVYNATMSYPSDGTQPLIYVNGELKTYGTPVLDSGDSGFNGLGGGGPLQLGRGQSFSSQIDYLSGLISKAKQYDNRALTAQEIKEQFDNPWADYERDDIALLAATQGGTPPVPPVGTFNILGLLNLRPYVDGWSVDILCESQGSFAGGGNNTYDYGLDANNDPTNAKVKLTVTSLGFDANGDATTVERTVYGTKTVRLPYDVVTNPLPSQKPDEFDDTGDFLVRVALSEALYGSDTVDGLTVDAGWLTTDVGTTDNTNNSFVGGSQFNTSTLAYPKPIANWAWTDRQRIEGDFKLRATAFHGQAKDGQQVAAMEFTIDDSVNTPLTKIVDTAIVDDTMGDLNSVIEYVAEFTAVELATLDEGNVTCDFKAYPLIGDAASVLNTATSIYTASDWKYRTHNNLLDLNDTYGKAYVIVDPAVLDGDTNGAAYGTFEAAETADNPVNTIARAIRVLRDYNLANHSARNNSCGGFIYLVAGDHVSAGSDQFVPNDAPILTWTEIRPYPGLTKSDVTIIESTTSAYKNYDTEFTRLIDLTFERSSANDWFRPGNASFILWLDDCKVDFSGFDNSIYQSGFAAIYWTRSEAIMSVSTSIQADFQRGVDVSGPGEHGYLKNTIGCSLNSGVDGEAHIVNDSIDPLDTLGGILAYNKFIDQRNTVLQLGASTNTSGVAIAQNVFELVNIGATPAMLIYAQESSGETDKYIQNGVFINNTIVGQRCNINYNATGTQFLDYNPWCEKNNIFRYRAWKGDTFTPADGTRVGNWPQLYGTCFESNITKDASFAIETNGIGCFESTDVELNFVDDASSNDSASDLGNGDYHLESNSVAVGAALDILLPYDIEGTARVSGGAAGAYEFTSSVSGGGGGYRGDGYRGRYQGVYRPRYVR